MILTKARRHQRKITMKLTTSGECQMIQIQNMLDDTHNFGRMSDDTDNFRRISVDRDSFGRMSDDGDNFGRVLFLSISTYVDVSHK